MASIELSESVYKFYVLSFLYLSLLLFSCVDVGFLWNFSSSSDVLRILLHSLLSFLCSLTHLCSLHYSYHVSLCVVRSAAFSYCHSPWVFLQHSSIICYLPTMGILVFNSSFLSPSLLPYIFALISLGTLP